MGSDCGLVIGGDLDAQLDPYYESDHGLHIDFYHLGWNAGPNKSRLPGDVIDALWLKPGQAGHPRFKQDLPPDRTYSARKDAIDFAGMRAHIEKGAGSLWNVAAGLGLPLAYAARSVSSVHPDAVPPLDSGFEQALYDYLDASYLPWPENHFAYRYFVSLRRLCYPREEYIDAMFREWVVGEWILIMDGIVHDVLPAHSSSPGSPAHIDQWNRHVVDIISQLPDETLISKIYFRQ